MNVPYQPTMQLPALENKCRSCRAPAPRDGRFCSSCGAALSPEVPSNPSPVEALLSEANLCRVRKDWDEAESHCLDVIRLDPNNVHAHSLLGDIYRDQGRLDHAAQWYQLAVDLDPGGAADRAKLRDAEDSLARGLVKAVHAGAAVHYPSGTQPLAGLSPSTWLRGLWVAFAVFVIVAVLLIVSVRARQNAGTTATAIRIGSPGTAVPSNSARKSPGMFVLPAQKAGAVRTSCTPIAPPVGDAADTASSGSSGSQTALPANLPGTAGIQAGSADSVVAGFTVDTAQNRAAVMLAERPAAAEPPEALRQRTVQNAYRAATSLFSANQTFDHLGVTVRLGDAGPAVFSGEVERTALARLVDAGDSSQMLSLFTNVWWNPELGADSSSPPTESTPGSTP